MGGREDSSVMLVDPRKKLSNNAIQYFKSEMSVINDQDTSDMNIEGDVNISNRTRDL